MFSGGGSGGHLTPSIAVAEKFLKTHPQTKILFIGSNNGLDESIIKKFGFKFKGIHAGKLRRYFSWRNFLDFFRFFYGIGESFFMLKKFKADLVFSKGGFVSLPVAIAAAFLRIPIIAHESDTISGLANRIISKISKKVCYTFPILNASDKDVYTGTPIREEILKANKEEGRHFLNFDNNKPIVLFMGASQGASQINDICKNIFSELKLKANIVLISGKGKKLNIKDDSLREYEFLGKEFPNVLKVSDIVISRAGANSLFELSALGKASIIIPLASSANNHQVKNAEYFKNKNAIEYFDSANDEREFDANVKEKIYEWIQDPKRKEVYEKNINKLFIEDAVEKLIKVIEKEI